MMEASQFRKFDYRAQFGGVEPPWAQAYPTSWKAFRRPVEGCRSLCRPQNTIRAANWTTRAGPAELITPKFDAP